MSSSICLEVSVLFFSSLPCRLAQSVKLMIAIAIFFTFTLQFYVPVSILWKGIESKISASRQNICEYGLRVFLVVSSWRGLQLVLYTKLMFAFSTTASLLWHCCGTSQSWPIHLPHRRCLPQHAGHDRALDNRVGRVLRGSWIRAFQVAIVEELWPDTVRHCRFHNGHICQHTRVPGGVPSRQWREGVSRVGNRRGSAPQVMLI